MSEKQKSLPNINAELHTISPLPLELVTEQIASLNYTGFPTVIDETQGSFIIKHPEARTVRLEGRFMRWNGTFTRIDCRSQSVREFSGMILSMSLSLISLVILLLIVFSFEWDFWGIFFLMIFGSPVLIVLFWGASSIFWANNGDKKSQKLIDQMLQTLADKITAGTEGALEFDGSPLSLEFLLQDEKYKHFRLGEDGEFEAQ